MSIPNLLSTAINSLRSHKLRTFLTMLGIVIGIGSVVTILSIGNGLKVEVLKTSEDTSANKINIYFMPENPEVEINLLEPFGQADIYNLQRLEGVQEVKASDNSIGMISFAMENISYFNKNTMTVLDTYDDNKDLNIEFGTDFTSVENDNRRMIVLDHNTAKELFDSQENAIGKGVNIKGEDYEVIGTLKEHNSYSVGDGYSYISKQSMENMMENNSISSIDIYLLPDVNKEIVFENAKRELMTSHPNIQGEYVLEDPQEITKAFESIINGLTSFIAAVSAISLFVGGIGVMNIMYVSVSERKREIGIRRAIGAKQKTIMLQFLFEAIMVTGIAGLIGILFGYLCARLAGSLLPFTPVLSVGSFIGATTVSVLIGITFGIIPASKAAKLDPIDAIYK